MNRNIKSSEFKERIEKKPRLNWLNTIFLSMIHLVALAGVPFYFVKTGFSWPAMGLLVLFYAATGLSITGGYHRLFSHRSYEASAIVRFFYLVFGAAAFQNSALKWSSDHRLHHRYVDQLNDPYSIKKGFFYAHIGWIFLRDDHYNFDNVKDLLADSLVMWQHRYYYSIAGAAGLVLPLILGFLVNDPWGGFLWGGIVRIVLVHHSTFLINSLSHYMGRQPYSLQDTSRDNTFTAFLTFGEGYHNYHHQFQYDYRNGIRWYQWDPTKWMIKSFELFKIVKKLRKASDESIFKARVLVQKERLFRKMDQFSIKLPESLEQKLNLAEEKLILARIRWNRVKWEYQMMKDSMDARRIEIFEKVKDELQASKKQLEEAYHAWNSLIREFYRFQEEAFAAS